MPASQHLPAPGQVPRHWVDRPADLSELRSAVDEAGLIAVDTEFIRERTYFPQLALLQLCTDQRRPAYLLDPTALNLTDFWPALIHSRVTVAVHAGSQDLELIQQQGGGLPTQLFDTQIAAELLGIATQPSYRYLVEQMLNIKLSKEQNRSDWLARPLSNAQLDYAAADAFYLRELVGQLETQLQTQNKRALLHEEMQDLRSAVHAPIQTERLWQKVRGNQSLNPLGRGVLAILATLRDQVARQRNLPRRWVFSDALLMTTAQKLSKRNLTPTDQTRLLRALELPKPQQQWLLAELEVLLKQPKTALPASSIPPALSQSEKELLKSWTLIVEATAEEHTITPSRLANRNDLRVYLQSDGQKGRLSRGWRQRLLAVRLDSDAFNQHSFTPSSD